MHKVMAKVDVDVPILTPAEVEKLGKENIEPEVRSLLNYVYSQMKKGVTI